ncbi:periplasmic serine peptidase DegS [Acinetobacter nectaris CIP 110549]|uniref:Periplasmic serine peptidase DegS n=1 Tax=Acinetobacter nectaris CIP 110549 TaxID=1392540 RepID=V2TSZ1_9GAMM|nr:trypsin-like peptidase domain-containing protein [Acinetobacter nectaris]ESK41121.1 periplasmic serine peptidase DegS [Acinetobacter nectaris CIP 110549]
MRKALIWLPWGLLVLVIVGFIGWQRLHQTNNIIIPKKVAPQAPVASDGVKMPAEKVEPLVNAKAGAFDSYSSAVKAAAPAVVNIFTTQKVRKNSKDISNADALREFFDRQSPELKSRNENNLGSGVIVRSDGYILTNNHVITQADKIIVGLSDGRRAVATVVGTDPDTDLAVIKIDLNNLPVVPFKLSGNEVGDVVLAIGNPFGVGQTVTQGIISALGRSDLGINTYEDFIQTDAAINPGNSGGALIDVAGNLIGVNTAIFSQSGGSLGIGFAIPAKICQHVFNSILKDGKVIRGWLGLSLAPPTYNDDVNTVPNGVVIASILPNGPAAQAGLEHGDRIVKVNNTAINSASHLINYVALQAPNTIVKVDIIRDNQPLTLDVVVGERAPQRNTSQYIPLPKSSR